MKRHASFVRIATVCGAVSCVLATAAWTPRVACGQAAQVVDEAAAEDPYAIPEGDAAAIDAFIQKLAQMDLEGETEDEQMANATKLLKTILEAADRMLEAEPTEDQSVMAQRYRLMALQNLGQLGDEDAAKEFAAAVVQAMENPRPEIASIGWQSFLVEHLGQWDALDDVTKGEFAEKIITRLKGAEPTSLEVGIVQLVASTLDRTDDPFVVALLTESLPILKGSMNDEVQQALADANLEGMLRRLNLMGQPMEIEGELLGGGEIDWKSYRGKVVLVDFSATWCGPCREEAPNVLNMYRQYHDKGFDVVAISLDRTEEDAKQYVKDNGIEWATLFPTKEDDRYWNHPMARHYGITGIPTAILLDQDGKAIHMNARGPLLQAELERLLGPPADETADRDKATGG